MLTQLKPLSSLAIPLLLTALAIGCVNSSSSSFFSRFCLSVVTLQADRNTPLKDVSVVVNGRTYVTDRAGMVDVTAEASSSKELTGYKSCGV
jgi:hypothetical protein